MLSQSSPAALQSHAASPTAPDGAPAISFDHVSKFFTRSDGGRLEVLREITFDVPRREVVAILGPSGSGKSTLLNIAAGLIPADGGRVRIMGRETGPSLDWSCVGYMFQDDRLLPWRSAAANVALALEVGSMPAKERHRRACEALTFVGLKAFADAYPHQLSGGMRSRIALARSLVTEPQILMMDEPFSRLDAQTRTTMHQELLRVQALRNMTILFVTHDVEEAVILADHVVVLSARPGAVQRQVPIDLPHPRLGTPEAVTATADLRASLAHTDFTQEIVP